MRYRKQQLNHTSEIMHDYHVDALMAKVIEAHDLSLRDYQQMVNPRLIYHDFSLFSEGEMALERIEEAIAGHEKICIYGDYDCDGILATAILVQAFRERGVSVGYHIPHRSLDGYGLNVERVRQIAGKGYKLIITVDNGMRAHEAVDTANELGVDVIITDHHSFDEDQLPEAMSIIHTELSIDYPFKSICGGFIAYKLAAALLGHHDKYLYTLAAITTISDMMPLLDENRSLVKRGLSFMNEEHYEALELLLGNQKHYTAQVIGYTIAPKINSFGRLPEIINPNIMVRYFLKDAPHPLRVKVAQEAITINSKRQTMTTQQYKVALEEDHETCLFAGRADFHEGIVGLIAGKYAREYEKPGLIMHYDEERGIYVGSARGVEGFNVVDFFSRHDDLLEYWGGHAMAGGFTVSAASYDALHQALLDEVENVHFEAVEQVIPLTVDDLTIEGIEHLDGLEPFGQGNPEPLFMIENVSFDHLLRLGDGKHLRFDFHTPVSFKALYFSQGARYDEYKNKSTLNMVGTLSINEFRHVKTINFVIKDII